MDAAISSAFLASFWLKPSTFAASSIRSVTSLRVMAYGGLNGLAVDDDAGVWFSLPFDLDRGGCESSIRCPTPLKELCGGLGVELRPLVGLAVMTSRGGSTDFEAARSFFAGFPTDVEDTRFDVGCVGVTSAAALDELDLSGGLREALLLLARAFAAAGCAEGSRLAALGFAAALGSEAARFGSSFSACGVGSSFAASFFCSRTAFRLANSAALNFVWSAFNIFLALTLGILGGGGGPWCGGGAMPAGISSGPDGPLVGSIIMSSRSALVVDLPRVRTSFVVFLMCIAFGAFPPPTPTMIGVAPGPGGPGGGWLLPCETSMGCMSPWFGFPRWANSVSFATYDWFTVCACGPRWLIIVLAIPFFLCSYMLMFC